MSQPGDEGSTLSPIKRALIEVTTLRARVAALERAAREPIAIVGMACRVPGGPDVDAYWRLLLEGREGIGPVPAGRWDVAATPGVDPDVDPGVDPSIDPDIDAIVHRGGFISDADLFDAAFFGVSPREAIAMDPQHRIVLELGWHALENANIAPTSLRNSATGVFLGISGSDYAHLTGASEIRSDRYRLPGSGLSFAPGRLAHFLGLQGPSMAIDAACSSSLVAVHLACRSLRAQESDLCLAGGVNLIAAPDGTAIAAQFGMIAKDGRCKTFDAAADGFVRAEGGGLVVLKRLADAIRDGDRVVAVIAGSAVNQDGPSSGLTVPNGGAQQQVIRSALRDAGLAPADISYVESHGTGTVLGDPIELSALHAALCDGRSSDRALLVGAVKTNIGHLESAAGVAGLIKAALVLAHRRLPPNRNFVTPSPMIPWDRLTIRLPDQIVALPEGSVAAGVSAFGASGTNVHLVLQSPPDTGGDPRAHHRSHHPARVPQLFWFSAPDPAALSQMAQAYRRALACEAAAGLADVCFTAAVGRTAFRHRRAIVAASMTDLVDRLEHVAQGTTADGVVAGDAVAGDPPKIAFLFTGQGSQYPGMARELYETEPTFRSTLERCDRWLTEVAAPFREWSLLSRLYGEGDGIGTATEIAQPVLFAIEYALAMLWQSWGIVAYAVAGHSLGEYVAACVAGVFSLEDGLRLVAARGALMQSLPQEGAMATLFADEPQTIELLGGDAGTVVIAALNAPDEVTISGPSDAVAVILARASQAGIKTRRLHVSHAFHSPLMDPILDAFTMQVESCPRNVPNLRLVSNATGAFADRDITQPLYWSRHLREPVRFAESLSTLKAAGVSHFLEIGPRPVLLGLARRSVPDAKVLAPSLRPGRGDRAQMLDSLASLFVSGATVNSRAVFAPDDPRRVALPTYPFQGQRFWVGLEAQSVAPSREPRSLVRPDPIVSPVSEPPSLNTLLRRCVADVLRLEPSRIDPAVSLRELGLDSLMAVELQAALATECGISVPLPDLLLGPTLEALAATLTFPRPAAITAQASPAVNIAVPQPARPLVGVPPRVRLVCLPYAAAGASVFRRWQSFLPPEIEVRPVQLPGREDRLRDPAFEDPAALVKALVAALAPLADQPLAVYGHSLGALLAFETAVELAENPRFHLQHLFVAACSAPHLPNPLRERNRALVHAIDELDEAAVMAALAHDLSRGRGVAVNGEGHPELLQALLPTLLPTARADLRLLDRYAPRAGRRLSCPITAFGGRDDADFPAAHIHAWSLHTTGPFAAHLIEGGHLFLDDAPEPLLRLVAENLNP